MLTLAAREADILMPSSAGPADVSLEEKMGWIREAAGERFDHLAFCTNEFGIELSDSPVPAGPISAGGMPVQPRSMTIAQAIEHLEEQRTRLGISSIQVQERQLENFAPIVARLSGK